MLRRKKAFTKNPEAKELLVTPLFSPDDGQPRPGGGCSVLLVVRVRDGSVVAAISGKVACRRSALRDAGFENFSIGPPHRASAEECEQHLYSHGPTSKRTILREVEQHCEQNRISLDDIAAERRFGECKDRQFGAALWLVWKEHLIAPVRIGVSEVGTSKGHLVRIGPHLLLNNGWHVTYQSCPSIRSAEEHMSSLAKELLDKATT